jgi:hypothetical protein
MLAWAVGVLVLVLGPVLFLRLRHDAAWQWFGLGIASWVLALVGKIGLDAAVGGMGLHEQPPWAQGVWGGLNSAGWELGMAVLFLHGRRLSTANVLAFGTGIGAFEVLFLGGLGLLEGLGTEENVTAGPTGVLVWLNFMVERGLTLIGHVASRVLIYVAVHRRWWLPAAVALVTFTAVDGVASYGWAAEWNWDDSRVLGFFYLFLATVAVVEVVLAWWFWRRWMARA